MANVTMIHEGTSVTVSAQRGQAVGELLRAHIPGFAMPCAGNHTCGKCLVLVEGAAPAADEEEKKLLEKLGRGGNYRLACCCRVEGDMTVTVPSSAGAKILSWYRIPEMRGTEEGYGFAVDIGTTTVAVQLIDRSDGRVVAERMAENAQSGFGADVISRIEACRKEGVHVLSERIAGQLETLAAQCLRDSGVERVEESVVTGNTTMLHIYEGLDPASLAVTPFAVPSYFGGRSRRTLAGAPVYLPRCVGAYVGADITCAALAAGLDGPGAQLLADIGTNGEIVLSRDGTLLCCSTAAGPAFEGAGLSHGMPARTGAIRKVSSGAEGIRYDTVNDGPPVGICGSGILDALAVMLETEVMDESGGMDCDWQIPGTAVSVTRQDVRQIQLAKGAICGGILTLLETQGTKAEELDRFVVAGGFGSSMDHGSAAAIGLYPAALRDKAAFLGNGALGGAVMLLRSRALREKAFSLAAEAEELSLSASSAFMDYYIDCMIFEKF